jgi:hypothetical protein
MIVLNTHIWVWQVDGDERISKSQIEALQARDLPLASLKAVIESQCLTNRCIGLIRTPKNLSYAKIKG